MADEGKQEEFVSADVQDVMRNFVSAVRAVKLYPANNPIYAQSIRKAFESFSNFFETAPRYTLGVQKSYFLFDKAPVGKETQLNKTIAQDLFTKGMREFVFLEGLTEEELAGFCAALALSAEEQALGSGIVSILWEQGSTHIKVTEAALDEVITAPQESQGEVAEDDAQAAKLSPEETAREFVVSDRTLVVGDLIGDPKKFGESMLDIARQTAGQNETVEDRLHALYQEAGRQINQMQGENSDALFDKLAKSVLSMDPAHRDKFIAAKLYGDLDAEQIRQQSEGQATEGRASSAPGADAIADIPDELHEIVTGRYSKKWTVQQISTLLKRSAAKKPAAPAAVISPSDIAAAPIPDDLYSIAQELGEYSPEEMEMLKTISEAGMESDIIEAAVRTMIFLIPQVRGPQRLHPPEKELAQFSILLQQLDDMLSYLITNKDYPLATLIIRSFHLPVPIEFKARITESIKKASTRDMINTVITDMRMSKKGSPEYAAAYTYLTALDKEATSALLDLLAVEKDRAIRKYLVDILKELGRKQILMIGRHISDSRWYVVRNIISILGESGSEEALPYMEKVTDHKQLQIRQEVVKGLINIGGKKAAVLLTRFLNDPDFDVQLLAIRGLTAIHGAGRTEAKAMMDFLENRPVRKKENTLTIEIIKVLAKIGDRDSAEFLKRYLKIRWWRARAPQKELKAVAEPAMEEIRRRMGDAGRAS